ncbi:hypothetical protein F5Y19DRAFT_440630 [Xylariaceae sp. FL1651]|nr:hypothetical protein F5Y19DRAFT_440630 [Xylariaceae sp. FL1651]
MESAVEIWKSEKIPVFGRGEDLYERSVATSNRLYRFSRPPYVVQPETAAHVQSIIKHAKSKNFKVTIKCGGHSYAGHSTAVSSISLDLRRMNKVDLDIKTKVVTIDAGCQWGHVYEKLINGDHKGFIINGGRCPFVGVSGFTLGGGLGPFTRSFGMGSDTLKEATVVTADGELVTVSDSDDPQSDKGRLFWALRGAGGSNFGVLVQMKLNVQQLQAKDGKVIAGKHQWFPTPKDPEQKEAAMKDFMMTMNDFYTTEWPNEITIDSTWICDLRQTTGDGVRFVVYFDGSSEEFEKLIDEHVKQRDLAKQFKRRCLPEASTRFLHETLVEQWSEETKRAFPSNKTSLIYSSFVFKNQREIIEEITAIIRAEMEAFRSLFDGERVEFLVTWIHSGGEAKMGKSSAYYWREAEYHTYVTLEWEDKWMEKDMRGFLGRVKQRLRRFSLDGEAAYVNFSDGDLPTGSYEEAYYGKNAAELRRVKAIWDKDDFFKFEQGVKLPQGVTGVLNSIVRPVSDELKTDSIARKQWEFFTPKNFSTQVEELTGFRF